MRMKIVLLTFFSSVAALILAQQAAQTQPTPPGSMPPGPPPANSMPPGTIPITPNNVVRTQNISTQNISGQTFSTNFMGTNGMGTNLDTGISNSTMSTPVRPGAGMGFGASTNNSSVSHPWKGPSH